MKLLKLLLPSFFAAYNQGQTQAFFERAYQLWFLRFPDPEHQITVNEDYGKDADYTQFIRKQREKVCIYSLFGDRCAAHIIFIHIVAKGPDSVDGLPFPINGRWSCTCRPNLDGSDERCDSGDHEYLGGAS